MLGGTFDPPHIGHLVVAQDVVEGLGLDRLLIVPAARPPHREAVFPDSVRYELTVRAFADAVDIEVSDIEMHRAGPSYTVDTLEAIRDTSAPVTLFCIIGTDQAREIESWHEYERIPELAHLVVMTRGGDRNGDSLSVSLPYDRIDVTRIDLSSTRVRERLELGLSIRYLVPESIRADVEAAWRARTARAAALSTELS